MSSNGFEVIGADKIAATGTKHLGFDVTDWLTTAEGGTTTISGTPTIVGGNCTGSFLSTVAGVVYGLVTTILGAGLPGYLRATITLANGEVIPLQIDLEFV